MANVLRVVRFAFLALLTFLLIRLMVEDHRTGSFEDAFVVLLLGAVWIAALVGLSRRAFRRA